MKTIFISYILPVVAGLLSGFAVMMVFEYINSFFYSLPEDLDWTNTEAVQAFTATLPATAYILVFLGWIVGSCIAGYVTSRLAQETTYRLAFGTGLVLVLIGLLNNLMLGHDILFNMVSLPLFMVGTYLGHRVHLHAHMVS
jgi:MFS family permease